MDNKDRNVYLWPAHFPAQCPSEIASDISGNVYRFINGKNPVSKDFLSHFERDPMATWPSPCNARGLSILSNPADCLIMQNGVPALRKKSLAYAYIKPMEELGLVAETPVVADRKLTHYS